MKKLPEMITETYEYDDELLVDIVWDEQKNEWDAWLYEKEFGGTKIHTTGTSKNPLCPTKEAFIDLALGDIENNIDGYRDLLEL